MTAMHFLVLLAVGVIHSALLWLTTLGLKRFGLAGSQLKWAPLVMAVPSSCIGFPFAVVLVTGIRPTTPTEWAITLVIGAGLGLPAALGAELAYQLAWKTVPRLVNVLIGRLGDGNSE